MFWKKLSEVLGSRNALASYLSLILLGFTANGVVGTGTPEEIINMFTGINSGQIIALLLINFLTPIASLIKVIVDKKWTWGFLGSANFLSQVLTLASLIVSAFLSEETAGVLVALVVQAINFIKHLVQKPVSPTVQAARGM